MTTGDSYTVSMAVAAVREAARVMEMPMNDATVAVVGANGAIGRTCAQLLAGESAKLLLVGRQIEPLEALREQCEGFGAEVVASTDINVIYEADLILAVTSAVHAVIEPQHLKPGAVVCDVARPRDVSKQVAADATTCW